MKSAGSARDLEVLERRRPSVAVGLDGGAWHSTHVSGVALDARPASAGRGAIAVDEPLRLRVGEVTGEGRHDVDLRPGVGERVLELRTRARCSQVITVPIGTSSVAAISL